EEFDAGRETDALARFDELTGEPSAPPPAARFANAVSRSKERFERSWRERDWDGVVAPLAPTFKMDDRRTLVRLQLRGEDLVASLRFLFEMPSFEWHIEL